MILRPAYRSDVETRQNTGRLISPPRKRHTFLIAAHTERSNRSVGVMAGIRDESGALGVHQKLFGHCGLELLAARQRDVERLTSRRSDVVSGAGTAHSSKASIQTGCSPSVRRSASASASIRRHSCSLNVWLRMTLVELPPSNRTWSVG